MIFFHRATGVPERLAILPGTFNPVTVAHLGLARASLSLVDEVVFVLPQVLPHKIYLGASFDQRIAMLREAVAGGGRFSVAASSGGLFLEIVRECRQDYPATAAFDLLCGRDAAERAMDWDYADAGTVARMLGEFHLLVAGRQGVYRPPPEWAGAIRHLELPADFELVSATEVRERIARGEPWEHLVPAAIHERVRRIY